MSPQYFNMNIFGYIYKITNRINGKVYIGQTIYPIEQRFTEHINKALNGKKSHLCYAIRKYSVINFSLELLETCNSLDEMNGYEIKYIAKYDSFRNGYNMTLGGAGRSGYDYKVSKKTRKKISEANKRRFKDPKNHPMYGKHTIPWNKGLKGSQIGWNKGMKMNADFREKCSKAKKGCIPWNKGIKMSQEFRKKISIARTGCTSPTKGKKLSDSAKKQISETLKLYHKNNIHPFKGKTHTQEVKNILSIKAKAQWAKVKEKEKNYE